MKIAEASLRKRLQEMMKLFQQHCGISASKEMVSEDFIGINGVRNTSFESFNPSIGGNFQISDQFLPLLGNPGIMLTISGAESK